MIYTFEFKKLTLLEILVQNHHLCLYADVEHLLWGCWVGP